MKNVSLFIYITVCKFICLKVCNTAKSNNSYYPKHDSQMQPQ